MLETFALALSDEFEYGHKGSVESWLFDQEVRPEDLRTDRFWSWAIHTVLPAVRNGSVGIGELCHYWGVQTPAGSDVFRPRTVHLGDAGGEITT